MEEPATHLDKRHLLLLIIALFAMASFVFINNTKVDVTTYEKSLEASVVRVTNTVAINGQLSAPPGFPQDIPYETGQILESAVTYHPHKNLKQWSLDYKSPRTVAEKYAEYINFMIQAGFKISEKEDALTKVISGSKGDDSFFVTIEGDKDGTTVRLSYLTSASE